MLFLVHVWLMVTLQASRVLSKGVFLETGVLSLPLQVLHFSLWKPTVQGAVARQEFHRVLQL